MSYNTLGVARRTKRFKGAEGCGARRVLVDGTAENQVVNPVAANAGNLIGVTWDSAKDDEGVALQHYGFAEIETAEAIPHGTRVNVAADGGNPALRGRIKAVTEVAGTINLVGVADEASTAAGQRIRVDIRRFGELV
ncbi:MAG: DUF2190 family protein [Actinomycetota bacterium]|nr:DUF2190 family protein [Actinomycetota bacterium]